MPYGSGSRVGPWKYLISRNTSYAATQFPTISRQAIHSKQAHALHKGSSAEYGSPHSKLHDGFNVAHSNLQILTSATFAYVPPGIVTSDGIYYEASPDSGDQRYVGFFSFGTGTSKP
jgi:hypothetical protein